MQTHPRSLKVSLRKIMNYELSIRSDEVLADVRSAAWLEQELHPQLDRHRRHQMADICEDGNVERVWRVLGNAVAELRMALLRLLKPPDDLSSANDLERPTEWTFSFMHPLSSVSMAFLREKIHEYLVASVMSDRCAVIIPGAADIWRTRVADSLAALRLAAATRSPVRRPLWPHS